MSSAKQRAGSSNAKGKQPARPGPDSSPELSEDDSEFELSDDIKAKLAKLEESKANLWQTYANLVDFAAPFLGQPFAMDESVVKKEPETSAPHAPGEDEGSNSDEALFAKLIEKFPEKNAFSIAIGLRELVDTKGKGTNLVWQPNPPNYGNARKQWIAQHPELRAFIDSHVNHVLIMECFDVGDGDASPTIYGAVEQLGEWYGPAKISFTKLLTIINGSASKGYTTQDVLTYVAGRIVMDGIDMNVVLDPNIKSASPTLINGLVMSHLRATEVTITLASTGRFEQDEDSISTLYKLLKGLLNIAHLSLPGQKAFKLLLINTEKSKAISKIKAEFPGIPVMQCPTGSEFLQWYPNGQMTKPSREDRKAAKKAAKKEAKKGQKS